MHEPQQGGYDEPVLRFDRRVTPRRSTEGQATVFCLAGDDFGRMHQIDLTDFCDGGLGAVSDAVISPGTLVSVGFSTPGCIARHGTVVRCLPCGDGYRVGIRFDRKLAA